jgi:uncharacterized protein
VQLESVTEGVYVSGTAHAPLVGECARCLDEIHDEITVDLAELFAYPDSVTDETTDPRRAPAGRRRAGRRRAARPRRPGAGPAAGPAVPRGLRRLCVECGEKWADLEPGHGHETLDPRWAALRGRLPAEDPS